MIALDEESASSDKPLPEFALEPSKQQKIDELKASIVEKEVLNNQSFI